MAVPAFSVDKNKDDDVLAGLESVGQNSPPAPQGAPPPGGALAAPAPAGDSSPAPAFVPEGGPKKGDTYYDLFQAADSKTQDEAVEEVEKQMGSHGTGIIAKTDEIASNAMEQKDGKTLNLLMKWGWMPPEERPAFDPSQGQVGDQAFVGPPNDDQAFVGPPNEPEPKKKFDRKQMGGFLMELGFNVLASNRDDAGGALGDAMGTTRAARTERKRGRAAEGLAASALERKTRREDEADLNKRNAEARAARKEERDIKKASLDQLEKFKLEDGTVAYYGKSEGPVLDKDGNKIKLDGLSGRDRDTLTAGQTRVDVRQAQNRFDDIVASTRERLEGFDERLQEELGENPTDIEIYRYAKEQLDQKDRILLGKEDNKGVETLDY